MSERLGERSGDSFFSRWSQRKQDDRAGKPLAEPSRPAAPAVTTPETVDPAAASEIAVPDIAAPQAPHLPTLADAQSLTHQSDFKPFMAHGVAAEVKNAALKKLFADPHFNVMDRLDTYIDDYSLPDPIPMAMMRQLASAKFLNLFEQEEKAEALAQVKADAQPELQAAALARDDTDGEATQSVAQSSPIEMPLPAPPVAPPVEPSLVPSQETTLTHDHPDLRLQPDHAPERPSLGRGIA